MRTAVVTVTLLALLSFTAPADAQDRAAPGPPPPAENPAQVYVHPDTYEPVAPAVISRYVLAARAYWRAEVPCANYVWGTAPDKEPGTSAAAAALGGCRVYIDAEAWESAPRRQRCETFVHEYGHLLGYAHTVGVRSIMSPVRASRLVPACRILRKGIVGRFERVPR